MTDRLHGIQTNIITGFLGAGKSTAILNLLARKPQTERWAILVNEFGEVGIDGGLLSAGDDGNVFIREVPGGCMCCAAGLPMQMAINLLLARAKPDRLVVEPTGLGHPFEVVNVLSGQHYQDVLDIRATVTLVDARKIADERYTSNKTFNEQLEIADIIVASKSDLYDKFDFFQLENYLADKGWLRERKLLMSTGEGLTLEMLKAKTLLETKTRSWWSSGASDLGRETGRSDLEESMDLGFPPEGFIRLSNRGEGFASHGWVFRPSFTFRRELLSELFFRFSVERLKALLKTDDGDIGYNFSGDSLTEIVLEPLDDSRIEIITGDDFDTAKFEQLLLLAAGITRSRERSA
ncbi:MAG: GTP-binding protein [Pseudomonadales bacterium]|nr:GTP-binding protein [Pseudomonadales bacterium]